MQVAELAVGVVVTVVAAVAACMDFVRSIRVGLGFRPSRLGHRTLDLYSRNQSRTNIVLYKEMKRGRVSLPSCSM